MNYNALSIVFFIQETCYCKRWLFCICIFLCVNVITHGIFDPINMLFFVETLKGHCLIFLSAIYQLFIEYFNIK